jgi:hypothetical protein
MADSHDHPVVQPALEIACGAPRDSGSLGVGVGPARADDRFGQRECLEQQALQVEIDAEGRLHVDLNDASRARPLEQPLHLRAGEPELVGNRALGAAVEVPPVRDARQQLVFVPAELVGQDRNLRTPE